MSEEKRTFSRMPVRLKGYARRMQSIESHPLFIGDTVGDGSVRDSFLRASKLPEDVTNFLAEMDQKMDRILSLLSKDQILSDFPISIEIMELSAAGVKLKVDESLTPSEPLEIIVFLSNIPLRLVSSKGRVLGQEADTQLYRFEFVDTRETDMELIVQFVFQQQREQIRNAKK